MTFIGLALINVLFFFTSNDFLDDLVQYLWMLEAGTRKFFNGVFVVGVVRQQDVPMVQQYLPIASPYTRQIIQTYDKRQAERLVDLHSVTQSSLTPSPPPSFTLSLTAIHLSLTTQIIANLGAK